MKATEQQIINAKERLCGIKPFYYRTNLFWLLIPIIGWVIIIIKTNKFYDQKKEYHKCVSNIDGHFIQNGTYDQLFETKMREHHLNFRYYDIPDMEKILEKEFETNGIVKIEVSIEQSRMIKVLRNYSFKSEFTSYKKDTVIFSVKKKY